MRRERQPQLIRFNCNRYVPLISCLVEWAKWKSESAGHPGLAFTPRTASTLPALPKYNQLRWDRGITCHTVEDVVERSSASSL